jgi:nucleoporin SEH1
LIEPKGSDKRWVEKARLVDSKGTVQDIEFSPNFYGLKLATVSVDGLLRVYEAMDIVNLAHWTLMEEVEVASSAFKEKESEFCLSWSKSRFLPQMLAVGCGKEECVKVITIYSFFY